MVLYTFAPFGAKHQLIIRRTKMKKSKFLSICGLLLFVCASLLFVSCGEEENNGGNPSEAPSCTHEFGAWTEVSPASCTESGVKKAVCTKCGAEKTEALAALGHSEVTVEGTAPSCTASGLTSGKKCSVCGEITEAQVSIPASAHSYENGSCSVCGAKDPNYQTPVAREDYTVTVKTVGQRPLKTIVIMVRDKENRNVLYGGGVTDENGVFTVSLEVGKEYVLELSGVPKGYTVDPDGYDLYAKEIEIILDSFVIPSDSESDYANAAYKRGDIMYDFTFKTIDGRTVKLSELLTTGGKKGVLLNFWFSTCGPCQMEFPHIQAVYERYKDEIAIVAIDPIDTDALKVSTFVSDMGLTFDIVHGGRTLTNAFGINNYPTSVFIDRYGTITFFEAGSLPSERPFEALFSKAVADDYTQVIYGSVEELLPAEKVDIEMESSEKVGGVLNYGDIDVTYYPEKGTADAEFAWPFIITEKDGVSCLKPSNAGKYDSYAIMHADVNFDLSKGDALVFDYWASTEYGADLLYVLVNGDDIIAISGPKNEWRTCCAYVAKESGVHTVTFIFIKDSTDVFDKGVEYDDTVYIKDLRIENSEKLNTPTYIPRECATNENEFGDGYENYAEIFLGSDGYYHVGSADGPLLLADLMNYTLFSDENSVWGYVLDGAVVIDGKNYYDELVEYCNYAAHSDISGLCPVNEELMALLKIVAMAVGDGYYNENDWLEMCKYYEAYGTAGVQLGDPIKGLAPHSAFDTVVNTDSDPDDYYPNTVVYEKLIMPRGLLYKFVPTLSGVYRIQSNSSIELNAWIFDEFKNLLAEYDRIERFPTVDLKNICMYMYFEAGKEYYIDIAFYEVTQMGTFTFKVEYVDESYTIFASASAGFFTYELDENGELTEKLIAGGIDVALGEDGYYHHVLPDGTLGSIVYADFSLYTNIFTSSSIYNPDPSVKTLLSSGAFDFSKSENDQHAIAKGWDKMTDEELLAEWGADLFDENYELYQIEDLRRSVYHGSGEDYTERVRWYAENRMIGSDSTDAEELYGCVAVDAELGEILQKLMDKMTFKGVENSWTKICYYYLTYAAQI